MDISERIQSLRKSKGLSQEQLAEKLNVSRQAVSKWESGSSVPDTEKIILLSDCLNTTTDYLLKGTSPQNGKINTAANYLIVSTAVNVIGLVVSAVSWLEFQRVYSVGIGIIATVIGLALYCYGQSVNCCKKAKKLYWMVNVWFITFIPLSLAYNVLCAITGGYFPLLSPIPLIGNSFGAYILFFVFYAAFCITTDYIIHNKKG